MFGFHPTAKSTAIVLAAAAATLFVAANSASAQESCVNGYRMLKGEIPVICESGPQQSMLFSSPPMQEEPLYTGSINRTETATAAAPEVVNRTDNANGCVDGYRWNATTNSGVTLPMACH